MDVYNHFLLVCKHQKGNRPGVVNVIPLPQIGTQPTALYQLNF